jgi:hypothetical protein
MTWQRREKILAGAAGALVALVALWFLLFSAERSTAQLEGDRNRLAADVQRKQTELNVASRDRKQLGEWQRRALPSDRTLARSLYQNWLRGLANQRNFRQLTVETKEIVSKSNIATFTFTMHANAALAELTQFLYDFYAAGHLHQIRTLDITPIEKSKDLGLTIIVEAVSLPDADRKDQLTKELGHGLKKAKLADYRDPIVKRDLFAAFIAGPTPGAAPPGAADKVDPGKFAFVTGFTEVDGVREVWLQDRMGGKTYQLSEGERFQIGPLSGKVQSIGSNREVVVEFDGKQCRLHDGQNLRDGVEIGPAEKPAKPPGQAAQALPHDRAERP